MRLGHWLVTIPLRLRSLFKNKQVELELDEEVRFHIDRQTEQFIARGMPPDDARYAALRSFDRVTQHKEECRDVRRVNYVEELIKDLTYAGRQLRRTPVLTTVVVLSLALGIGANAAIFSAIDAVMLRRLPVERPQDLVMLGWSAQQYPETLAPHREGGGRFTPGSLVRALSYPDFEQLRDHNHVLSSTFSVAGNNQPVNVGLNGRAETATMQGVSGNYFQGLGVRPAIGRLLLQTDDKKSAPPVAVLSHDFWIRKLGGNPSVVGQTLSINAAAITIVGIAQEGFSGLNAARIPEIWIPLSVYASQSGYAPVSSSADGTSTSSLPYWESPQTWWLQVFGRLKPGISSAEAIPELTALFDQSIRESGRGADSVPATKVPKLSLAPADRGVQDLREFYATPLLLLMGAVGLVLIIACGNVAALLLARATSRSKEIALRLALGAGRIRLIRQLLTESILLALIGGVAGLLVAKKVSSVLITMLSSNGMQINSDVGLNWHVLAFVTGLSILTGLAFGLAPALRATKAELMTSIKQAVIRKRFGSGKLIVGAQVALCLALVTSAGLFLRTLQNIQRIDAGFDSQHLLLFTIMPGLNGYTGDRLAAYYENLRSQIESIPGVSSATIATRGPIGQGTGDSAVLISGYTPANETPTIPRHQVGPGYFETIGIPLTMGRGIRTQDTQNAPKVVVVNEKLVREYFHEENPLGHHIQLGDSKGPSFEIVGVAKDVKYFRLQDEIPSTIYYPYTQFLTMPAAMTFAVRSKLDTDSLTTAIRNTAGNIDPNVPVTAVRTETEVIHTTFALEQSFATLTTSFGLLALLLSCIGLYGTMAYAVTQRTREIGLRMALGAHRESIIKTVLQETTLTVLGGLALGWILTFAIAPVLQSRLFGLPAHDPLTILAAALVICGVSILAGYIPARSASKIDPMIALRHE